MPITVVVRSATGEPPSLTFDGARVVIGRSDGCDVRLPDPSVSLRHASIRVSGADYTLVDEGSTNGTWVGGVKLHPQTPRIVRSGDLVRLGRVWLELVVGQRAATADIAVATRELALALVRRAMDAVGDDTRARVTVVEGPDIGAELPLAEEGRSYVVGRAERCDLALADEDASREHLAIVRRPGIVLVRDLGSRNGVFLGEARIEPGRDVPWRAAAMLRVGASVLALDEPVGRALAELEAAADEALAEADAPAPPASVPASAASAASPASAASAAAPASAASAAPASLAPASAARPAPIAAAPERAPAAPTRRRGWTPADLAVVTIAVAIIGASLAGLYWVLRS